MREKQRASLAVFSNSGSSCSHAGLLVWSNGITGRDCKQCSLGSISHWTSLERTDMGSWVHPNSWYSSQTIRSIFRGLSITLTCMVGKRVLCCSQPLSQALFCPGLRTKLGWLCCQSVGSPQMSAENSFTAHTARMTERAQRLACATKIFQAKRYIMLREHFSWYNERHKTICSTLVTKLISIECNEYVLVVSCMFFSSVSKTGSITKIMTCSLLYKHSMLTL